MLDIRPDCTVARARAMSNFFGAKRDRQALRWAGPRHYSRITPHRLCSDLCNHHAHCAVPASIEDIGASCDVDSGRLGGRLIERPGSSAILSRKRIPTAGRRRARHDAIRDHVSASVTAMPPGGGWHVEQHHPFASTALRHHFRPLQHEHQQPMAGSALASVHDGGRCIATEMYALAAG